MRILLKAAILAALAMPGYLASPAFGQTAEPLPPQQAAPAARPAPAIPDDETRRAIPPRPRAVPETETAPAPARSCGRRAPGTGV